MIATDQQHDINYRSGESYHYVGSAMGKRYIDELKKSGYPFYGQSTEFFIPGHIYFDGSVRFDGPVTGPDSRLTFIWIQSRARLENNTGPAWRRQRHERRYEYGWIETKYGGQKLIAWCPDETVVGIPNISRCMTPVEHGIPDIMSFDEFNYIRMMRSPQWD